MILIKFIRLFLPLIISTLKFTELPIHILEVLLLILSYLGFQWELLNDTQ